MNRRKQKSIDGKGLYQCGYCDEIYQCTSDVFDVCGYHGIGLCMNRTIVSCDDHLLQGIRSIFTRKSIVYWSAKVTSDVSSNDEKCDFCYCRSSWLIDPVRFNWGEE